MKAADQKNGESTAGKLSAIVNRPPKIEKHKSTKRWARGNPIKSNKADAGLMTNKREN